MKLLIKLSLLLWLSNIFLVKESLYSLYPGLIFRETFNSETDLRKNGGVPTSVIFSNGTCIFNGSSSKVVYTAKTNSSPVVSGTENQNSGTPVVGTTNIIIGNDSTGVSTFNGKIGFVRVYEGILALENITQIWTSTVNYFR